MRIEQAELLHQHTKRVRALVRHLQGLLSGRISREQVLVWLHELRPTGREQPDPFISQPAVNVYESLVNLDERLGADFIVRETDLRAYMRWLIEGICFRSDGDALFVLERDIDEFAVETGAETVRWWESGLGWWTSLQFGSPTSGRPYVAVADLRSPNRLGIHAHVEADRNDAIVDLFEFLALDDRDVSCIHRNVDLSQVPMWALIHEDDHGHCLEIDRFRSYSKARTRYCYENSHATRQEAHVYSIVPVGI